jgi:hypothetical protein
MKYLLLSAVSAATLASFAASAEAHKHHAFCGHVPDVVTGRYILSDRWNRTATDGSGIQRGDPITITWGLVPDGTSWIDGTSDLIDFLDTNIGAGSGGSDLTQRPWFDSFQDTFDRWGELGGASYVFETNDDGSPHSTSSFNGQLGVRADVRIGGSFRDGNSGVLASNFFPGSGGDMTLDTGDVNFYSNPFADFRPLRNVLLHEHGHGLGMSHIESNNAAFLMEPFINTSFDGPQLDDLRALHRGYGDRHEKGLGNDSASTAVFLGDASDALIGVGLDGDFDTRIERSEVDFVSIDGSSDVDFFSFSVADEALADLTLTPLGAVYNQGPQNGSQSSFDTRDDNDLSLAVFDTDGQTLLADIDLVSNGIAEVLSNLLLPEAGTYFARVLGDADRLQMYALQIATELVPDLRIPGDANNDGRVDLSDFLILRRNFGGNGTFDDGDFNGDGVINLSDFLILRSNFGTGPQTGDLQSFYDSIPEPGSVGFLAVASLLVLRRRRSNVSTGS